MERYLFVNGDTVTVVEIRKPEEKEGQTEKDKLSNKKPCYPIPSMV